ncbi:MAG TPA: hypothetical protein VMO26_30325 [Vicinamibacterales bacterium]|nr:hypothetical protein [Vicinamibacterales bacterium]
MTTTPRPPSDEGSALRLLAGLVFTIVALAAAAIGFSRLFAVLEAGGYGTPAMRTSFVVLGIAGACLATGIATLIWDISKRFERR